MLVAAHEHCLQMFGVAIHCAGDKGGIRAHCQSKRVKRMVNAAKRCGLCYFIFFRCGGILPLRQSVDLVIEQEQVHVKIPAQQVNGVVTADAQSITITRYDPNAQLWAAGF